MNALCLTLPEQPERTSRAALHFSERWPDLNVHFVTGISGLKSGLASTHPYEHDHPGSGYKIGPATIAIFLSHYIAWSIVAAGTEQHVLILEDDAIMCPDFKERTHKAILNCPGDFDMLFLGSCCTEGHVEKQIAGEVFDVRYPQCLHAYILAKKAAPVLLNTYRDVYGPIDCLMRLDGYAGLKVLTALPRLAEQMNTELPK